jgi:N-acetylmuramoyl-L-alanine amidase
MSYRWLDELADWFRQEGLQVIECSGWKSRGRPSSTGNFNPSGVLWHHTGTTSSMTNPAPTLNTLINGRSDLPGPLCHASPGYDGKIRVVAAGRANHAGTAEASGPVPGGDGNAIYVGLEIDYNGTQPMSLAQYECAIGAAAAILRHL